MPAIFNRPVPYLVLASSTQALKSYQPIPQPFTNGFAFASQFRDQVMDKTKRQTFRRVNPKEHIPQPGESIVGWVEKSNGSAELILNETITMAQTLHIDFGERDPIYVDGHPLTRSAREIFAAAEGFKSYLDLCEFVYDQYGLRPFNGVIIHW